ncbi:MAG: hypothetical protein AAGD22_06085 [Verrucomicrobiota bacterium]
MSIQHGLAVIWQGIARAWGRWRVRRRGLKGVRGEAKPRERQLELPLPKEIQRR